ncbi:MAG: SDR family NAD(P)-dependent oxidoreductase, partial [Chitinivibrionales bacterium]|nr:SDR family NAD(P)-dependent oxidoreductase [Chitinivibrionales bacterium]
MQSRHSSPISATIKGIADVFRPGSQRVGRLTPDERIDGKVCLVTGANSGLGKAIATGLAARGGRIVMACRTMDEQAREEIVRRSGNPDVSMRHIDLADLEAVRRFCEQLAADGVVLDRVVL